MDTSQLVVSWPTIDSKFMQNDAHVRRQTRTGVVFVSVYLCVVVLHGFVICADRPGTTTAYSIQRENVVVYYGPNGSSWSPFPVVMCIFIPTHSGRAPMVDTRQTGQRLCRWWSM